MEMLFTIFCLAYWPTPLAQFFNMDPRSVLGIIYIAANAWACLYGSGTDSEDRRDLGTGGRDRCFGTEVALLTTLQCNGITDLHTLSSFLKYHQKIILLMQGLEFLYYKRCDSI